MIEDNLKEHNSEIDSTAEESASEPSLSEPNADHKRQIASWVKDGMGLSDIQRKINDDFGIVMTYMDVRFLVDDLDLELVDEEDDEETSSESDDDSSDGENPSSAEDPLDGASTGGVNVELDTVTPPGAMASGSVTFSDGIQKKWTLDQFGRLGLTGGEEGYKPSDEDVIEFQKQLDAKLRGKGF